MAAVVESLRHGLDILQDAGVDGPFFCNEGDRPYPLHTDRAQVAAMAAAIERRLLFGVKAVGVTQVWYMREHDFGLVPRALDVQNLRLAVSPLEMPILSMRADSTHATYLLAACDAGVCNDRAV